MWFLHKDNICTGILPSKTNTQSMRTQEDAQYRWSQGKYKSKPRRDTTYNPQDGYHRGGRRRKKKGRQASGEIRPLLRCWGEGKRGQPPW